jgi:hypothetical protein
VPLQSSLFEGIGMPQSLGEKQLLFNFIYRSSPKTTVPCYERRAIVFIYHSSLIMASKLIGTFSSFTSHNERQSTKIFTSKTSVDNTYDLADLDHGSDRTISVLFNLPALARLSADSLPTLAKFRLESTFQRKKQYHLYRNSRN